MIDLIILICGATGAGKSTISKWIHSDSNFGNSKNGSYRLSSMEAPGLENPMTRRDAAISICNSLKVRKRKKIIFLVELEAGRIRPFDPAFIRAILHITNIDHLEFGIVFNKLSRGMKKRLQENNSERLKLLSILTGRIIPISNSLLLSRYGDIEDVEPEDAEDNIKEIPGLADFLSSITAIDEQDIDPMLLSSTFEEYLDTVQDSPQCIEDSSYRLELDDEMPTSNVNQRELQDLLENVFEKCPPTPVIKKGLWFIVLIFFLGSFQNSNIMAFDDSGYDFIYLSYGDHYTTESVEKVPSISTCQNCCLKRRKNGAKQLPCMISSDELFK